MTAFNPENTGSIKKPEQILEKLPESIDNEGTLFAYGFLLDKNFLDEENLKKSRPEGNYQILEAINLEEAMELARDKKNVVILRGVKLEGIRAQIITDEQMAEAYKKKFGKKVPWDTAPNQYLYAKKAEGEEKARYLNGGIIINLTPEDFKPMDANEGIVAEDNDGIYWRQNVPELEIAGAHYKPEHIKFYGGNIGDFHKYLDPENEGLLSSRVARQEVHEGSVKREISEHAKWPHIKDHRVRDRWEGKTLAEEITERAKKESN
jgi:hypothetical protein